MYKHERTQHSVIIVIPPRVWGQCLQWPSVCAPLTIHPEPSVWPNILLSFSLWGGLSFFLHSLSSNFDLLVDEEKPVYLGVILSLPCINETSFLYSHILNHLLKVRNFLVEYGPKWEIGAISLTFNYRLGWIESIADNPVPGVCG